MKKRKRSSEWRKMLKQIFSKIDTHSTLSLSLSLSFTLSLSLLYSLSHWNYCLWQIQLLLTTQKRVTSLSLNLFLSFTDFFWSKNKGFPLHLYLSEGFQKSFIPEKERKRRKRKKESSGLIIVSSVLSFLLINFFSLSLSLLSLSCFCLPSFVFLSSLISLLFSPTCFDFRYEKWRKRERGKKERRKEQ